MILTKTVNIKPRRKNKDRYINLGYIENDDGSFDVSPYDLPSTSQLRIKVQCDELNCNNIKEISYYSYCLTLSSVGHYRCKQCGYKKARETCLEKYGTKYPTQLPEFKEKQKQTYLEKYGYENTFQRPDFVELKKEALLKKYGVEHQLQSKEVWDKIKDTNLKKYGCEYSAQNKEIQKKMKQTNLEKYGCEYVSQSDIIKEKIKKTNLNKYGYPNSLSSPQIREKIKQTNLEKYGCENVLENKEIFNKTRKTLLERYGVKYPIQNKDIKLKTEQTNIERYGVLNVLSSPVFQKKIKETNIIRYGYEFASQNPTIQNKMKQTRYLNGNIPTSIQQQYLCNIYKGILNYPLLIYSLDILVDNFDIEFDGSGHDLCVKHGNVSQEQFLQKEIIRNARIERAGYQIIRIISKTDKLPSDTTLLQMLDDAKQYFNNYPNHSWFEFDIDNEIIRNAEHKDGIPYFYGELRKIKKTDLESA